MSTEQVWIAWFIVKAAAVLFGLVVAFLLLSEAHRRGWFRS